MMHGKYDVYHNHVIDLVSTHIVCKSKLGFQNFWFIFAKNTLFLSSLPCPSPASCPLPPENEKLARTWHFVFGVAKITPPPGQWKVCQNLALWDISSQETPPLPQMKIWPEHFEIWVVKNTPYPKREVGVWRCVKDQIGRHIIIVPLISNQSHGTGTSQLCVILTQPDISIWQFMECFKPP